MGYGYEKGTEVQWNDNHIFKNWVVKEFFALWLWHTSQNYFLWSTTANFTEICGMQP